MRPSERQITAVLKSRGFTWLLIVTSLVMGWVAYNAGIADEAITVDSMWLPDPERWIASRWASALSSIVLTGGCCILMAFINKVHNLMRTVSLLFVGLFTIMLAALPKSSSLSAAVRFWLLRYCCLYCCCIPYMTARTTRGVCLWCFLYFRAAQCSITLLFHILQYSL